MCKVILFGGTTEGRVLAEFLAENRIDSVVCVATEYGASLMKEDEYVRILDERLDEAAMKELFKAEKPEIIVDATHPYAKEVTANIRSAAETLGISYLRVLRESNSGVAASSEKGTSSEMGTSMEKGTSSEKVSLSDHAVFVDSVKDAVSWLKDRKGRILASTGSKELGEYTAIPDFRERVFARVLSTAESVNQCVAMGFEGKNLIAMQGPFSPEMNIAMIRQYGIDYLVTKVSGKNGGYEDKIQAAKSCGITAVIVGKPEEEEGISVIEARAEIAELAGICPKRKISLIGIGMGSTEGMTSEALSELDRAELVIGSGRMLEPALGRKPVFNEYNSEKIAACIDENRGYSRIAILLSGDTGFYSGARKLISALGREEYEVEVIPGISSVAYFCAKIGNSWDDAVIVSNHGRKMSLIPLIRDNGKVFSILGKKDDISGLAEKLREYEFENVTMHVGEKLSYDDEKISSGTPEDFMGYENDPLCVVMIENHDVEKTAVNVLSNLRDDDFIRAKVPMTKEEIRTISVSRLGLKKDSVCYDVGAGTGSVSIEMALKASQGTVYAIEKKSEAVELLHKNVKKFKADNVEIIEGLAPEAMEELPAPTHVFIGGSSGNMDQIIEAVLKKTPQARFVINCIAMESTAQALECAKKYSSELPEITQVAISRGNAVGSYTLMKSENPITIISFDGVRVTEDR